MPIKIVVTGPECTGKTTLCAQLSERYKGTMIPEFSRTYLNKRDGFYQMEDIVNIGLTQNLHNKGEGPGNSILFCDTDALTCYIWANEKFGKHSALLESAFSDNLPDLYLLCYPDLKWEYDQLRESQYNLDHLFNLYLRQIVNAGAAYAIINGIGLIRTNRAAFFINNCFPELISFAD